MLALLLTSCVTSHASGSLSVKWEYQCAERSVPSGPGSGAQQGLAYSRPHVCQVLLLSVLALASGLSAPRLLFP